MSDYARVVGEGGLRGTVLGPSNGEPDAVAVELEDGREISVPASRIHRQADGTWHIGEGEWKRSDQTVVPVISEELNVAIRKKPVSKVRVENK